MKFQCENLTKTLVDFKCSPFTIRILINWTKYDSCTILQDGAYRLGRKFGTLNEVDSDLLNTFDKSGSRPRCVNKENFVVLFWNESIQLWLHGSGLVHASHVSTINKNFGLFMQTSIIFQNIWQISYDFVGFHKLELLKKNFLLQKNHWMVPQISSNVVLVNKNIETGGKESTSIDL